MRDPDRARPIEQEIIRDLAGARVVWTDRRGVVTSVTGSEARAEQLARDIDLTGALLGAVGERSLGTTFEGALVTYGSHVVALASHPAGHVAIVCDRASMPGLVLSFVQRLRSQGVSP